MTDFDMDFNDPDPGAEFGDGGEAEYDSGTADDAGLDALPLPLHSPEMNILTRYLAGDLDDAGMDAVEARMRDNGAFAALAAPLLAFWDKPIIGVRYPKDSKRVETFDHFLHRTGRTPLEGRRLRATRAKPSRAISAKASRVTSAKPSRPRPWRLYLTLALLASSAGFTLWSVVLQVFPQLAAPLTHVVHGGSLGTSLQLGARHWVLVEPKAWVTYTDTENKHHGYQLDLQGSARFTLGYVTSHPHRVTTPSASIDVLLPAKFLVDASYRETRVVLLEGKLRVEGREATGTPFVMAPGDTVIVPLDQGPKRAHP